MSGASDSGPSPADGYKFDRAQLLPRSGVGVLAPWLVVAPPGNPPIRLDLRILDRVAICEDASPDDSDHARPHAEDPGSHLLLVCGDLEIALFVADGAEAVERLVHECAAFTCEGHGVSGEEAKPRRSDNARPGDALAPTAVSGVERFLIVGDDPVRLRDDYIVVGKNAFRVSEVREYAMVGANLPLAGGHLLQAAMAMIVIAVEERDVALCAEDFWTARSGGGDGPVIVWLHGGPGLWDYLTPLSAMTDSFCVSYRYDQRGCGRTRKGGPNTVAQNVADLEMLCAHWGHDRLVLAGHSWGASLALHYTLAHPERVAGLILISTHELIPGSREAYREERDRRLGPDVESRYEPIAARMDADQSLENERARCEFLWAPDFVDPAAARTLFVDDLRVNDSVNDTLWQDARRLAADAGFLARLRSIEVPTLVVHGEHDPRPSWAARDLATLLPRAILLWLPSAAHFPWVEQPDAVRAGIEDFVKTVART